MLNTLRASNHSPILWEIWQMANTDSSGFWTADPPSTAGYYWWREPLSNRLEIVSVWLQNYWKPGEPSQLMCVPGHRRDPVAVLKVGGEWWSARVEEPGPRECCGVDAASCWAGRASVMDLSARCCAKCVHDDAFLCRHGRKYPDDGTCGVCGKQISE